MAFTKKSNGQEPAAGDLKTMLAALAERTPRNLQAIQNLTAENRRLSRQEKTNSEKIAAFREKRQSAINGFFERYESHNRDQQLIPELEILGHYANTKPVSDALFAIGGETLERDYIEFVNRRDDSGLLSQGEVDRKVAENQTEITRLWKQIKSDECERAAAGFSANFPADIPLEILLIDERGEAEMEILNNLRRRRDAFHGQHNALHIERSGIEARITAVESEIESARHSPNVPGDWLDQTTQKKSKLQDQLAAVNEKFAILQKENNPTLKLLSRGEEFSRKHHFEDKPYGVNLVTG